MKIFNQVKRTFPIIAHMPGDTTLNPMWAEVVRHPWGGVHRSLPDIAFITWNSGEPNPQTVLTHGKLGLFEASLGAWGLPCTVLGRGVGERWHNRMKIDTTVEFLEKCETPYVVGVDSADAMMVADPADMIDRFKGLNCGLVFGASTVFWPPAAEPVQDFEADRHPAPWRYLNGGTWMGRTATTLAFFRAAQMVGRAVTAFPQSEQICLKFAYPGFYPEVTVDSGCVLFQNLNRDDPSQVGWAARIF